MWKSPVTFSSWLQELQIMDVQEFMMFEALILKNPYAGLPIIGNKDKARAKRYSDVHFQSMCFRVPTVVSTRLNNADYVL